MCGVPDSGFFCLDTGITIIHTVSMKTAISIPDPVFQAADKLARRLGISRSELYQRAIRRFLAEHSHGLVRAALDAVYGEDEDSDRLDPAVEYLQKSSLPEDDW